LGQLTTGVAGTGILAYTNGDRDIREWYQNSIRTEGTDDLAKVVKTFGDGKITIPFFLGMALLGELAEDSKIGSLVGKWATGALRTMLVGAPPLLFLQGVLGGSRPTEDNSRWHPFKDTHSVSGHSFMGAVPFLSAALMTENAYLKTFLYLGSMLCGISRLNDDKHYFSHVALGWWLAYLSAKSVHKTDIQEKKMQIVSMVLNDGIGIGVHVAF
jgi:membrane-associated phospholipid phosphatase